MKTLALLAITAIAALGPGCSDSFNPPPLAPMPPRSLSYSDSAARYTAGIKVPPNVPTFTGAVTSWSVDPALPPGLTLGANGEIAGTPTATSAAADYVVTATNDDGFATTTVTITVDLGSTERVVFLADRETAGLQELYSATIDGGLVTKLSGPLVSGGNVIVAMGMVGGRYDVQP